MYKAVQTSRLYEQIVQQIEQSIQEGALKEDDQLPAERELALQFGVSRTAVREAVKRINADKAKYLHYFIDYHKKKDAEIGQMTVADLREGLHPPAPNCAFAEDVDVEAARRLVLSRVLTG